MHISWARRQQSLLVWKWGWRRLCGGLVFPSLRCQPARALVWTFANHQSDGRHTGLWPSDHTAASLHFSLFLITFFLLLNYARTSFTHFKKRRFYQNSPGENFLLRNGSFLWPDIHYFHILMRCWLQWKLWDPVLWVLSSNYYYCSTDNASFHSQNRSCSYIELHRRLWTNIFWQSAEWHYLQKITTVITLLCFLHWYFGYFG